jgi:osmotically-inducible protein OsmY
MTDRALKQQVQDALDFEPALDASDIGVAVAERVVTLRGTVASYAERISAERVALRINGAKAVANDLVVHVVDGVVHTDTEIAQAALAALEWNAVVPPDSVRVTVANGWVTLKGTVEWECQRDAAANMVRDLIGVQGITNTLAVEPPLAPVAVRRERHTD